jgi:signal transduction histidine kinase
MNTWLIQRQLERAFGRTAGFEPQLLKFVAMVDATYRQADEDRRMNEHIVQVSSTELQSANDQLRSLIKALPDTYIHLLADGTVKECQGAVEQLNGVPVWTLIGRLLADTCLAPVADQILAAARSSRACGQPQQLEVQIGSSQSTSFLDIRVAPTELGSSAVVVREVTKERQAQAQLAQAQKLEAIGQLAAGIAHEINTPTQYIGDNLRFLRDALTDVSRLLDAVERAVNASDPVAELQSLTETCSQLDLAFLRTECPSALAQSLDGVERVSHIVYSMKEFAHPDGGEKGTIDLNRVVTSATTVCRNEWKYLARLDLVLCAELPMVPAFAGDIGQVVLNLVVNAAHAIKGRFGDREQSGLITVSTYLGDDRVVLEVRDNGEGIVPEHRERIFEQFFTTKPVGQGTGQGLALVRRIVVDRHGGDVTFESKHGEGSTFRVALPLGGRYLVRQGTNGKAQPASGMS